MSEKGNILEIILLQQASPPKTGEKHLIDRIMQREYATFWHQNIVIISGVFSQEGKVFMFGGRIQGRLDREPKGWCELSLHGEPKENFTFVPIQIRRKCYGP